MKKVMLILSTFTLLFTVKQILGKKNQGLLVDEKATKETQRLFKNLKKLSKQRILFGHQNALKEGKGWVFDGTPDIKKVSGFYPAIAGFDFSDIFNNTKLYYGFFLKQVKKMYDRKGIVTFSWHMKNPVTSGDHFDGTPAVHTIIPGGRLHELYKKKLNKIASFALEAKGSDGKLVPIIFRPFHEHNGNWFWWSRSKHKCLMFCFIPSINKSTGKKAESDFIKLWQFTVDYLKNEKNVHNFIYAYSPTSYKNRGLFWRYPGDKYVDILGFGHYGANLKQAIPYLKKLVQEAETRGKLAAITETGHEGIKNSDYWTESLIKPIKEDKILKRLSYLLIWKNSFKDSDHFFAPYPGHHSVPNFLKMVKDPFVIMREEIPYNLYKK